MKEFPSFGAFSRHLEVLAAVGEEVTHHITENAAKIIRDDAQKKIGEYQDYAGPFKGWDELADSTKDDKERGGYVGTAGMDYYQPLLRTGELRDSITYQVHGNEAAVGSDSDVAMYQELGTETIPARSFLGGAAFEAKRLIGESAARTMIAWIAGLGWKRPPRFDLPS